MLPGEYTKKNIRQSVGDRLSGRMAVDWKKQKRQECTGEEKTLCGVVRNCGSWIFASRICPNCGAWVGDDSADEQDFDHPVELAIMGDTLLSCSGREAKVVVPAGVKELEEYSFL